MRLKLTHTQAVFLMVAVTLMWSIAGVITRHLEQARSFEITFWRSFFTVLSLLVILPFFQGREVFAKIRHGGPALWVSGLCWSVMFTAFMLALTLTSVANVLVTMAVGPFLTALIARIFIGHRIPTRTWLAILVAGAGIGYMYGAQIEGGQIAGTLVALCVPLAGAVNWTVTQRSHAHGHDVDLVPAVLVGAVGSSLLTLPLAMPLQASAHDVGLLALLGLVQPLEQKGGQLRADEFLAVDDGVDAINHFFGGAVFDKESTHAQIKRGIKIIFVAMHCQQDNGGG